MKLLLILSLFFAGFCSSASRQDIGFGKKIVEKLNHDILVNKLEDPVLIWAKYFGEVEEDPEWQQFFYANIRLYVNLIKCHRDITVYDCPEFHAAENLPPCTGESSDDFDIMVFWDSDSAKICLDGVNNVKSPRYHVHKFVVAFEKGSGKIQSLSAASE